MDFLKTTQSVKFLGSIFVASIPKLCYYKVGCHLGTNSEQADININFDLTNNRHL